MTSPLSLPADHAERMQRARLALDGLSIGDAFGGQFFIPTNHKYLFGPKRESPPGDLWHFTDDTVMALSIVESLDWLGGIDQELLARRFAARFQEDLYRGYGATAVRVLADIGGGVPWRQAAQAAFDGAGSMGNGAAMRVAPLGAYFADDLAAAAAQARLSAEVTHQHPEGIAGGIAVAVAAAVAWHLRQEADPAAASARLFEAVLDQTPAGATRRGVEEARALGPDEPVAVAAQALGNGSRVTAPDTVPFCLWVAARHLFNFADALWTSCLAGGDLDTTAAIIGGVVALAVGRDGIPAEWLQRREPLPPV
jgi:ADP-ribosylglycohydrolase